MKGAGAQAYVVKSYGEELVETISRLLRQHIRK